MGLVNLLLVEDNPGDVELTRIALAKSTLSIAISVVGDGLEALSFLRREGTYAGAPRPDLILLDLNMPRMDGRELLEHIKAAPDLLDVPVVILTTSASDEDVRRTYRLHANCYITKPVDFERFAQVVARLEEFWFTIVRLPLPSA